MQVAASARRFRTRLPRGGALPVDVWERRHRGIRVLAWLHVPVCALLIVFYHGVHVLAVAACAYIAMLALAAGRGSQRWRATMATGSLLVSSALLIHLSNGLIETHFHFFVVIAAVAMYQMWTPYLLGIGFVLAHHAVMGTLAPSSVFNHHLAIEYPLLFAGIHTAFVLAESAACLVYWSETERAVDAEREARIHAEEIGEQLTRANAQIADLLAMMSHDLRTPVAVVTGYGSMARESWDELDDDTRRTCLAKMEGGGWALEQMLTDTLTIAALDAEGLAAHLDVVRVDEVVREVLDANLPDQTAVLASSLEPVSALVDGGQLRQVIANLVTNATKYGAPPLGVSCRVDGDTAELRLYDSGPGVPSDFVPHLFDRWARADEARRGGQKGTGLGLYIVQRLARSNGGDVRHEPRPGGGACFVVTLPLAAPGTTPEDSDPGEHTGRPEGTAAFPSPALPAAG